MKTNYWEIQFDHGNILRYETFIDKLDNREYHVYNMNIAQ